MPGLASPGRVSALAVDRWSLKKSKLAFQRTPQDLEEDLKMAKVNQMKKNFLNNYKIGSGLREEMLLARSKEVGDKVLANERQTYKSPRVVPGPVMTRQFHMYYYYNY